MLGDIINTKEQIKSLDTIDQWGRITKIEGSLIESKGLSANLRDVCEIKNNNNKMVKAEVIGFSEDVTKLMLYGENFSFSRETLVRSLGGSLDIKVGEELLGRVLNGLGDPIDTAYKGHLSPKKKISIYKDINNVLERSNIDAPLQLGIKSIDGLLTVGKGQRMGIFSGSGVGKSTLLSMIARNNQADVNVVVLVGERGREVKEFIDNYLGEEGLKKTVLVVSTSDDAALTKVKSVYTGTSIAEYFRDQGLDVVLMVDSLTRLAHSQRLIGSYLKEPPTSKGYPPSLFEILPSLLERSGKSKKGSITGFYSVLVEGDDLEEPITDAVRGILDGHVILSRKIAKKALFPAIDIPQSISRLMPYIINKEHLEQSYKIKEWISVYQEMEDLINVGAYVSGNNPILDEAITKIGLINDFLKQDIGEQFSFNEVQEKLNHIFLIEE